MPPGATSFAVLAHPHPLYGGSMRGGLIEELFRLLPGSGIGALRFNFRGVGRSSGTHDKGIAEQNDVAAALEAALDMAGGSLPVFLCGWSFGSDVLMCVGDARHAGWVFVAPPLRITDPSNWAASTDSRPKLLAVPEHDQYRPPEAARPIVAEWPNTTVSVIPGADHFLFGHEAVVAEMVVNFANRLSA